MKRYASTSVLMVVLMLIMATTGLWATGTEESVGSGAKETVVNWEGATVEKPQYGGVLNISTGFVAVDSWDPYRYHQTGTPFHAGIYQFWSDRYSHTNRGK